MSMTMHPEPVCADAPRLLDGTELLGKARGSGLREPPYLVRRRDGQVVQLSRLLYEIAARMDGRSLGAVAACAGQALDLCIKPEQVAHVAEHKLAPLGLVPYADGSEARLEPVDALLALRFRAGIVSERTVNVLARTLQPLFSWPVVIAALAALAGFDLWLAAGHGIGAGLREVIRHPALGLALFALVPISLAFHECGHAAACRYGGARPGRIGIGIYLIWPVFFTDVTDSYRLGKAGRLRTDLGGVYFNALFALTAGGAYLATGYEPLLIVVVSQQMLILDQFIPWVRLDGYHIVSDLIGVSDLFARIKPVLAGLVPGRPKDPRVTALKTWARVAVTAWVLTTVAVLSGFMVVIVVHSPAYLRHAWESLFRQLDAIGRGLQVGSVLEVVIAAIGTMMLLLPVAGLTMTYLLLCRRVGAAAALRRVRTHPTLAAVPGEKVPQPSGTNVPALAAVRRESR
jgi:putative peptide zinc metalloprotease protein